MKNKPIDPTRLLELKKTRTCAEIAEIYGLPVKTVQSRVERARVVTDPNYAPCSKSSVLVWKTVTGEDSALLTELRALAATGLYRTQDMADKLGITKNMVIGACHRHHVVIPHVTQKGVVKYRSTTWKTKDGQETELAARIRRMFEGLEPGVDATTASIADAMGMSVKMVLLARRKLGYGTIVTRHVTRPRSNLKRVSDGPVVPRGPHVPSVYARKRQASGNTWNQKAWRRVLPSSTKAENDRLVAEAIAAGKVTKCPPAIAYGATRSVLEFV